MVKLSAVSPAVTSTRGTVTLDCSNNTLVETLSRTEPAAAVLLLVFSAGLPGDT